MRAPSGQRIAIHRIQQRLRDCFEEVFRALVIPCVSPRSHILVYIRSPKAMKANNRYHLSKKERWRGKRDNENE